MRRKSYERSKDRQMAFCLCIVDIFIYTAFRISLINTLGILLFSSLKLSYLCPNNATVRH